MCVCVFFFSVLKQLIFFIFSPFLFYSYNNVREIETGNFCFFFFGKKDISFKAKQNTKKEKRPS